MQKLHIEKSFDFAHRGCDVVAYAAGTTIETDDAELLVIAVREGWATLEDKANKPPQNKAKKNAPENK